MRLPLWLKDRKRAGIVVIFLSDILAANTFATPFVNKWIRYFGISFVMFVGFCLGRLYQLHDMADQLEEVRGIGRRFAQMIENVRNIKHEA